MIPLIWALLITGAILLAFFLGVEVGRDEANRG